MFIINALCKLILTKICGCSNSANLQLVGGPAPISNIVLFAKSAFHHLDLLKYRTASREEQSWSEPCNKNGLKADCLRI